MKQIFMLLKQQLLLWILHFLSTAAIFSYRCELDFPPEMIHVNIKWIVIHVVTSRPWRTKLDDKKNETQ